MSTTYVIGDVQGCLAPLQQLLQQIWQHDAAARLIFAGDLVNRGPDSLGVLRLVRDLQIQGRAESVLGNHDLHLLALAAGLRQPHRSDTLDDVLAADDATELLNWLRHRPLVWHEKIAGLDTVVLHAGVYPAWDLPQLLACAAEVEQQLRADNYRDLLAQMYGNQPARWSPDLQGWDRSRAIINALTRMRFCSAEGEMEFASKDNAATAPAGYAAWFDLPRASSELLLLCGHWSTLGLLLRDKVIALDTGCVWGGRLSAVELASRRVLSVACEQCQRPGK